MGFDFCKTTLKTICVRYIPLIPDAHPSLGDVVLGAEGAQLAVVPADNNTWSNRESRWSSSSSLLSLQVLEGP